MQAVEPIQQQRFSDFNTAAVTMYLYVIFQKILVKMFPIRVDVPDHVSLPFFVYNSYIEYKLRVEVLRRIPARNKNTQIWLKQNV